MVKKLRKPALDLSDIVRKPQHFAMREIVALAKEYLAGHRAELIAEAKEIVERWRAEGVFGPRGDIRSRPALAEREQRDRRRNRR